MLKKMLMVVMVLALLGGCASMVKQTPVSHSGSVLNYLYAGNTDKATMKPEMATLKLPLRIGLAFVPSTGLSSGGVSEAEQTAMLNRVKESFLAYPFVKEIQIIPGTYLTSGGGFENLTQVGRLFDLDVVTLLTYDQIQFNDSTTSSMLYWTLVGAYVVKGDQYDVHTLLEASVFDIPSHKLLFRAPGSSKVKGAGSMVNYSEKSRVARVEGFSKAIDDLIPNLKTELEAFRVKARSDTGSIQLIRPNGYPDAGK